MATDSIPKEKLLRHTGLMKLKKNQKQLVPGTVQFKKHYYNKLVLHNAIPVCIWLGFMLTKKSDDATILPLRSRTNEQ